jgi:hypothetical protein
VWAEWDASAAVEADKGVSRGVEVDGIHRACAGAFAAADAEIFPHNDTATFALCVGTRWTGLGARGRVAGEAGPRFKACRQAAR